MTSTFPAAPRVGDLAPDSFLPDGTRLSERRGSPLVLAFAPDEWNPGHALESETFARLAQEFFVDDAHTHASLDAWHALDSNGETAREWGVSHRAVFVLDEAGVVCWHHSVQRGETIRPGEVLAALETLSSTKDLDTHASSTKPSATLSRRSFLAATLAAAAVLSLPLTASAQALPSGATKRESADYPGSNAAGTILVRLKVNGRVQKLQIEPRVALLDALREVVGLTGTKKGCDHGQCGACTVHIDGARALSCLTLAVMNEGREITTIEGLANGDELHPMQSAFIQNDAFQCGYCTPGQIMSAVALVTENRAQSDAEVREAMSGNLCRCAAYPNIIAAIQEARRA